VEGIQLPAALALLLRADLGGAGERLVDTPEKTGFNPTLALRRMKRLRKKAHCTSDRFRKAFELQTHAMNAQVSFFKIGDVAIPPAAKPAAASNEPATIIDRETA